MDDRITGETLALIAAYDVPTIANAVELFGVRDATEGFMSAEIRSIFPEARTTVGFAVTSQMSAIAPPSERHKRLSDEYYRMLHDARHPTIAVVQDMDERPVGSLWGEVNATMHRALGCVGAVTNGGVRDLAEVERLGFGYFASCVLVSHAHVHLEEIDCPVAVGGLPVRPGDLVAADRHGVISIPLDVATRLPDACRYAQQAELPVLEPCRAHLASGTLPDPAELAAWRARMHALRREFRA